MTVRIMQIQDYPFVFQLWLNTSGMGLNDKDDSEYGIKKFLNRNPATCFVAELNNRIVGVILSGHDGRRGYIYHLAVAPENRRQGIGSILLGYVLKAMANEGINKIALVAFTKNDLAKHFWTKHGFELRSDLSYRNKAINVLKRIDT